MATRDNYFPFFSNVQSKGLVAELTVPAKTSPSLPLDTYILGNQLQFTLNLSVEKFRHAKKRRWDALFLVSLHACLPSLLPVFLPSIPFLYMCICFHPSLSLVTSKNSALNLQIIIVLPHTSINIYSLLVTAS